MRQLLDENGIDPAEMTGTGLGGRITRADVLAVIDGRRAGGAPATRHSGVAGRRRARRRGRRRAAAPRRPDPPRTGGRQADEIVPFTNIRRRTAEHMVRSKATSPHTLVVMEADYEQVERVRRAHGAQFKAEEGFSLTYLPFVARATVEALREWPYLNASVGDDALIVHHEINLGIAVDLDHHGLIVPVVRRAEELTLRGLARRIRELADRARTKKLSADDIAGGTFSITNAGPFGTFLTAPIINQPQVAILSTDGVKRRPGGGHRRRRHRGHRHPLGRAAVPGVGPPGRRRGLRGRVRGARRRDPRHPRLGRRALSGGDRGAAGPLARPGPLRGGARPAARAARRAVARTTCCCSSTPMSSRWASHGDPAHVLVDPAVGRGDAGARPTGAATSPTTGRASWSATRSSACPWAPGAVPGARARASSRS